MHGAPGSCLKAGRELAHQALLEQVRELDLEGIVAKHRHILPFTSRIVSKATGNLRPILNLTVILGSLPNTDRRESNPGPSHGNQTLLEIPPMKYLPFTLLLMAAAMLIACGAGHPRLTSIAVSRSEERRVGKSVDLGGRRIIKKKKNKHRECAMSKVENTRETYRH